MINIFESPRYEMKNTYFGSCPLDFTSWSVQTTGRPPRVWTRIRLASWQSWQDQNVGNILPLKENVNKLEFLLTFLNIYYELTYYPFLSLVYCTVLYVLWEHQYRQHPGVGRILKWPPKIGTEYCDPCIRTVCRVMIYGVRCEPAAL